MAKRSQASSASMARAVPPPRAQRPGQVYLPELASVTVYALMAAILLWRPAGLYGRI